MDVQFRTNKLRDAFLEHKIATKQFGDRDGKLYIRRINELASCETLGDVLDLPFGKPHALSGERAGEFAINMVQPRRLIFVPLDEEGQRIAADKIKPGEVKSIQVWEVVNYHD